MERNTIETSIIPKGKISEKITVYEVGVHNYNDDMTQEEIETVSQQIKEKFIEELSNVYTNK